MNFLRHRQSKYTRMRNIFSHLTAMAKAAALVRGRDYVLPEDVSLVFGDVVPHRLLLSPRAEADRSFDPASELLERVPAPRIS